MFLEEEDYEDTNNNNTPQPQQHNNQNTNNNQSKQQQSQKQSTLFQDDEIEDLDAIDITTKPTSQQRLNYQNTDSSQQKSQSSLQSKMKNKSFNQSYQDRIKDRTKQLNTAGQATVQLDDHKGSNDPNSYHTNIDFGNLQQLSSTTNGNIYEPGQHKANIDDLPSLQPVDNQFQVKKEEFKGNLIISDDDSDNEATKKPTTTQKTEEKNDNVPAQNLFSESSENDEEEDQKPPSNQKLNDDEEDEENNSQMVNVDNTKEKSEEGSDQEEEEKGDDTVIAKPMDPNYEIPDMREFLTKPLPKGLLLQCTIKRDKSGMGHFYPKYHLYFSNRYQVVMAAKKRSGNKTSNYIIGLDKNKLEKKSPGFLGKVRSNFLGTEFTVFDTGDNPKEAKSNFDKVRKELAAVVYESNLLGAKGPRKMKVLIPAVDAEEQPVVWKPLQEQDTILHKFKNGNMEGMHFYYNKPPKWNEHVQAFVLNFNGRVDKPSVKNFQLVDEIDDEKIYLQFGRVGNDIFNMDLQYPLSPLQAFGICLSSFDYKIACE